MITRYFYREGIQRVSLPSDVIFVFGSNLAGRHGKGAAKIALEYFGATTGNPAGLQGLSYAIPTKDEQLTTLPLNKIKEHVEAFKDFAKFHPQWTFFVTPVGTGLAGLRHEDIAEMFDDAPENCIFTERWKGLLNYELGKMVDY